jgi:hypothetical protein
VSSKSLPVLVKLVLLLGSLLVLSRHLGARVDGEHYWRQTHVAANIERYVTKGLSLKPTTYNLDAPVFVFDFPLYQLMASALARGLGWDSLVVSRALNVAFFAMTFLVVERLLAAAGVPETPALLTLFFFVSAPLNLFYFQAPLVDGLAVFLSVVSLWAYLLWEEGRPHGYPLLLVSGALCTFVKNPVYLPVPVAIAFCAWSRAGWRGLLRRPLLVYFAVLGGAVVLFKVYSNDVNGISLFLTPRESGEYFGTLHDRLRFKSWLPILATLATRAGGPAALALAGLGGYRLLRGKSGPLLPGLLLGSGVTLLVFVDKYNAHSYYCLPLVLPLAAAAAFGAVTLRSSVAARAGGLAGSAVLALVLGATLVSSYSGLRAMSVPATREMARCGDWIRLETHEDDFVFYLVGSEEADWLPAFLYFAKREGYNLAYTGFESTNLRKISRKSGIAGRRLLVFCPESLEPLLAKPLRSLATRLEVAPGIGGLYLLDRGRFETHRKTRAEPHPAAS